MAVLLTDDFNRADNAAALGSPAVGGPYTVRNGTWGIIGNRAYTSVSNPNGQITYPAAINVDLQASFPVLSNGVGLLIRWVDASNFWYLGVNGSPWSLMRVVAGSFILFSTGPIAVSGDVVRCVAYGRNLYGFVNGRMVLYAEDPFFSAATAVAGIRISSSTTNRLDDLSASDSTGIPGDGGTAMLSDLTDFGLPGGPPAVLNGFLYKGRDSAAADAGSVA